MMWFLVALALQGNISNQYGRVGIKVGTTGRITHVYNHSPAYLAGLQEGDKVLEADGRKGYKLVDGIAGTDARLKVRRGKEILFFTIPRVPKSEVFDVSEIIEESTA